MDTGAECRIHAAEFLVQAKREPERGAHLIRTYLKITGCCRSAIKVE